MPKETKNGRKQVRPGDDELTGMEMSSCRRYFGQKEGVLCDARVKGTTRCAVHVPVVGVVVTREETKW